MRKSIFFILIFVIVGFLISFNGFAQDEDIDVSADENITAEDLGIAEPRLLPDSPLYFVKDFWRKVRTKLTFNPIKKAEFQLKIANERLIEAKKLAEKNANEQIFQKTMDKYQAEMEIVRNRIEAFKEKATDNPKIDKFLDKLTDRTVKQQRLMDGLEKKLSDKPEILEKIRENKEKALEHFGEAIERLEEKDKIPERLEKSLEKIEGSKYKNFKNLEVLLELENKVSEQAKEAIQKAQENILKRLHGDLEQMSSEDQEKFGVFLDKASGDQANQLRILERLNEEKPTPVLKQRIDQNIERAQERAENMQQDRVQIQERLREEAKEQGEEPKKACITLWDPVCGKNGKTYSNACFAELAGVEITHKGRCEAEINNRLKSGQ